MSKKKNNIHRKEVKLIIVTNWKTNQKNTTLSCRTVPIFNNKIAERVKTIPLTHIYTHDRTLPSLGTGTSMKGGGMKQVVLFFIWWRVFLIILMILVMIDDLLKQSHKYMWHEIRIKKYRKLSGYLYCDIYICVLWLSFLPLFVLFLLDCVTLPTVFCFFVLFVTASLWTHWIK